MGCWKERRGRALTLGKKPHHHRSYLSPALEKDCQKAQPPPHQKRFLTTSMTTGWRGLSESRTSDLSGFYANSLQKSDKSAPNNQDNSPLLTARDTFFFLRE